jgi:hypothetical protein
MAGRAGDAKIINAQYSIYKQQKKLLPIKRIINFVLADVSREDSFSGPVKFKPLY